MWQGARRTVNCVLVFSSVTIVLIQLVAVWIPEENSRLMLHPLKGFNITLVPNPVVEKSSCSRRATARGPGQRVLSFVFYGDKNATRRYFQGIAENAALVSSLYPGWLMRVYHDLEANDPDLPPLEASYPHLDLCSAKKLPRVGNVMGTQPNAWRFFALCDPLVDILMSRDLDSRVSSREKAAVDEWLASGLRYHVMRDHPRHQVPLLAGMWGVRLDMDARDAKKSPRRFCSRLTRSRNVGEKLQDQRLLWNYVWPTIKGDVLQHDAYSCDYYRSHGNMRPWPTRRLQEGLNFEGSRDGVDVKPMHSDCDPHCRPTDHQDWKYC